MTIREDFRLMPYLEAGGPFQTIVESRGGLA